MASQRNYFPFKIKLSILMSLLAITCVLFVGITQYYNVKQSLIEDHNKKIELLQHMIINSMRDADIAYYLLERDIDNKTKKISYEILDEYKKVLDPGALNLESFILNEPWLDIYIIDSNYVIKYTTDEADLNLDFKTISQFAMFLNNIFNNGEYVSDRTSISIVQKKVKKFSYLPTRDKKYIIEVGVDIEKYANNLKGMDLGFTSIFDNIKSYDNCLEDVTRYNAMGISYNNKNEAGDKQFADTERLAALEKSAMTRQAVEITQTLSNGEILNYKYMPYEIVNAQRENDIDVIEIIHNHNELRESLRKNRDFVVVAVIGAVIVAIVAGFMCANLISKPIEKMMYGIREVRKGNYNLRTSINTRDEFRLLSSGFDEMVHSIKELLQERALQTEVLMEKNKEINSQKEEIATLYQQTSAMNEELYDLLDEVRANYLSTVRTLVNSIEAKDRYTKGHCERVTKYALKIAKAMGLTETEQHELEFAGLLHDIGKIGIPDDILNKRDMLTEEEAETIKRHPEIGFEILKGVEFLHESNRILLQHHERYDGRGYPQGLKGEEIVKMARILSVADAYDAMTSSRPYRQVVLSKDKVIEQFVEGKNTQFDADVVDVFISVLEQEV